MSYDYDRRASSEALLDVLKTLDDLRELDENLDEIETAFSMHFHTASALDPTVKDQFAVLRKALEGLKVAKEIQKSSEQMVKLYPEDKVALRAKKDADTMVGRFEKHAEAARKIIRTLTSKQMPPALKKLGDAAAKIVKDRLVDPSTIQVLPWASDITRDATYQVILRVNKGSNEAAQVTLEADTSSTSGPYLVSQFAQITRDPTPRVIADALLKQLVGWPGLKGESEATEGRAKYVDAIMSALNSAARRLQEYDMEEATKSKDLRTVEVAYRSSLPKEGERSVGEHAYDEMVTREIADARKAYEAALAPWKDKIEKIDIHDGEKSWIYTTVTLK